MIHDILVHVPTERVVRPVVDASVSLAAGFGAHLDAVAIGYVSASSTYVMDGGAAAAVAAVFEMERERAAQRAAAALEMFEIEALWTPASPTKAARAELPGMPLLRSELRLRSFCSRTRHKTLSTIPFLKSCFSPVDRSCSCLISFAGPSKPSASVLLGRKPAGRPRIERCATVPAQADALVAISINGAQDVSADASSEELARHLVRACR